MTTADLAGAMDRLRLEISTADALARATHDTIAAMPVDDVRGHERVAILAELTANATRKAWEATVSLIALCEQTASERARRPTEAT